MEWFNPVSHEFIFSDSAVVYPIREYDFQAAKKESPLIVAVDFPTLLIQLRVVKVRGWAAFAPKVGTQ